MSPMTRAHTQGSNSAHAHPVQILQRILNLERARVLRWRMRRFLLHALRLHGATCERRAHAIYIAALVRDAPSARPAPGPRRRAPAPRQPPARQRVARPLAARAPRARVQPRARAPRA